MLKLSWILLGLVACADQPLVIDVDSHEPYATLYDDGANLRITGCSDGVFLGCGAPGLDVTMTAMADGTSHDVPQSSDAMVDQLLGLFHDGPFQLTLPTPADGQLGLVLDGVPTTVTLLPAFAVTASATQLSRSADGLTITHAVFDRGITKALVISTCGRLQRTDLVDETTPGRLEITFEALAAVAGPCTHEIHVDQRVALDSPGMPVDDIRIERVTATSAP